jgi:hypothetical protein
LPLLSIWIKAEIVELLNPVRVWIPQALIPRGKQLSTAAFELGSKKRERERQIDLTHHALTQTVAMQVTVTHHTSSAVSSSLGAGGFARARLDLNIAFRLRTLL